MKILRNTFYCTGFYGIYYKYNNYFCRYSRYAELVIIFKLIITVCLKNGRIVMSIYYLSVLLRVSHLDTNIWSKSKKASFVIINRSKVQAWAGVVGGRGGVTFMAVEGLRLDPSDLLHYVFTDTEKALRQVTQGSAKGGPGGG